MKIDKNEFFREVTLRISSSLEVGEAMDSLFEYLKDIFPLDGIILHYMENDGSFYSLSRAGEIPDVFPEDVDTPIMTEDPETWEYLENKLKSMNYGTEDTHFINHPWPDFVEEHILKHHPDLIERPSTLMLKLTIKDELLGEFGLIKYADNVYKKKDAELLQVVKEPITIAMSNARRFRELERLKDILADDYRSMRQEMERISGNQVIGAEFGLRQTMEMVRQVSPLNNPVLLLGETGTGKEVIANAIHLTSPRRDKPMIRVQCGAIPDTLLDSELFGHEKGAFTGAITMKRGRFERANGGTIFLDEIGELTMDAQVKLLRVLQEHEFERLGGSQTIKVDVRVIAATHRDLEQMVKQGKFREDLWYRLNVFPIELPPLRMRKEDISLLTTYFINRKAREIGLVNIPRLAAGAISELQAYDWPGNVRELQNVVERALIISNGRPLGFKYLNTTVQNTETPEANFLPDNEAITELNQIKPLNEVIAEHIRLAMRITRGKIEGQNGAAGLLEMNPSTLRAKMRKMGIKFGKQTSGF